MTLTAPKSTPEERKQGGFLNIEDDNVWIIDPAFISKLSKLSSHHEGLNLFIDFFESWNHLEDGYIWSSGKMELFKGMITNIKDNLYDLKSKNSDNDSLIRNCDEVITICEDFIAFGR